ncbi:MAG: DUF4142 domain-containing protein [Candidatus Sulfotelmatobacter sp.]
MHSSEVKYEIALADRDYLLGVSAIFLALVTSAPAAQTPAASAPGASLGPADTYFVTQTSLGTPFQVDSGRLAETKCTIQAIRSYAELMVSSHITVNNALLAILVSSLQHETGEALDADYVGGR